MLTSEEAQKRRALIEELYSARAWATVRDKAEELARTILDYEDRRIPIDFSLVQELCEIVTRVEHKATADSWAYFERELERQTIEAVKAEMESRKHLKQENK